ncbi:hypothetical protein [Halobacillus seohaensis]|uniref:Uncharacterized protein n=1 Tax=Halobacillus seohaensis TaxID=447421 RepID=A0ABW2EKX5_9BACI
MKNWLITVLAICSIAIWSLVVVVFTSLENEKTGSDHSQSITTILADRPFDEIRRVSLPSENNNSEKVETIVGKHTLSEDWVEDVSEDGKVSIDTILETLELN